VLIAEPNENKKAQGSLNYNLALISVTSLTEAVTASHAVQQ